MFSTQALSQQPVIKVVTEDAYPLQYIDGNEIKGPAYQLVKKVLERAKIDYELKVLPWARAYALASFQPNTLIFSIARTPQRENSFHWVGVLMDLNYYLYGLSKNFPNDQYSLEDLRSKKIGSIIESATYQHLKSNGFINLYSVTSPKQNYEKLLNERIDLFPANVASFKASCMKFQQDCRNIVPIAPIGLPPSQLYFALSKTTESEVLNQIEQAYSDLLMENAISSKLQPRS